MGTLTHTFVGKGKTSQGTIKRIVLDYTDSFLDSSGTHSTKFKRRISVVLNF